MHYSVCFLQNCCCGLPPFQDRFWNVYQSFFGLASVPNSQDFTVPNNDSILDNSFAFLAFHFEAITRSYAEICRQNFFSQGKVAVKSTSFLLILSAINYYSVEQQLIFIPRRGCKKQSSISRRSENEQ